MGFSLVEGVEGEEGAESSGHDCEVFFSFLSLFFFFLFFFLWWRRLAGLDCNWDLHLIFGMCYCWMGMWDADCDAE